MEQHDLKTIRNARVLMIAGGVFLALGMACSRIIENLIHTGSANDRPEAGIITAVLGVLIGAALLVIGKVLDLRGLHRAAKGNNALRQARTLAILSVVVIAAMVALQILEAPLPARIVARVVFFLVEMGTILVVLRGIRGETKTKTSTVVLWLGIASAAASVASMWMQNATTLQAVLALLPPALLIIENIVYLRALHDTAIGAEGNLQEEERQEELA